MTQKKYTLKLTKPEISHIQLCLDARRDIGDYSGNKEQFWKRHAGIDVKLFWATKEEK